MGRHIVADVERALGIEIPAAFASVLRKPGRFEGAGDLYVNPEQLLVANLELRNKETKGWRDDWPTSYLLIGHDGCGGMHFIDTVKAVALYWDHETDAFEKRGTVTAFLASYEPWSERSIAEMRLVISRVDPSWKSILDPIPLAEFVEACRQRGLQYLGHKKLKNPFTRKQESVDDPGLARWKKIDVRLVHGRVFAPTDEDGPSPKGLDGVFADLARSLNAKVLRIKAR
jgi:hypothetical protein